MDTNGNDIEDETFNALSILVPEAFDQEWDFSEVVFPFYAGFSLASYPGENVSDKTGLWERSPKKQYEEEVALNREIEHHKLTIAKGKPKGERSERGRKG